MSIEPKSEQMIKSMVASLASQAVSIFLQSKEEQRESEVEYVQELDWLRMNVEDLQEKIDFLEKALAKEKEDKGRFERLWLGSLDERDRLREELKKIKSDAATPDQEVSHGD